MTEMSIKTETKQIEMNELKNYSFSLFNKTYIMFVSNVDLDYAKKFFDDLNNGVDFHLAKLDFVKSYFVKVLSNKDKPELSIEYYLDIVYKRQPRSFFYEDEVNKIFPLWETYTKAKNRENNIDDIFRD